ncbi:MAG: DUF4091 domain-containing protein [Clostridia bacterium]|nr:DUF4091 domain-containing protein [Clostridia bacterium]
MRTKRIRIIAALIAFALIVTAVLAGCKKPTVNPVPTEKPAETEAATDNGGETTPPEETAAAQDPTENPEETASQETEIPDATPTPTPGPSETGSEEPGMTEEPSLTPTPEPGTETEEPTGTEGATETATGEAPATESAPATEGPAATAGNTEKPTETATGNVTPTPTAQAPTATPTPEATPTPTPKPEYNEALNVFGSWDSDTVKAFSNTNQTKVTLTDEGIELSFTGGSGDPHVDFNVTKYSQITGKNTLAGSAAAYIVFWAKGNEKCDGSFEVFTQTPKAGDSGTCSYNIDSAWHPIIVEMTATTLVRQTNLTKFRIDWTSVGSQNGAKMVVKKIEIYPDRNSALSAAGLDQYVLNIDTSITDNDPLANTVLTAPNEDSTLSLWFEQSTEKLKQSITKSSGRTGYTVKMAKNESENAQFFLSPKSDVTVRIEVDPFTNSSGETVDFVVLFEYYHKINTLLYPDAVPPLTGPIDIKANTSQGFLIQLTTKATTKAGTYNSVIHVFNNATNQEIKRAAVAVKVWDFALSEETEMRTAFAVWYNYLGNSYSSDRAQYESDEQYAQLNYLDVNCYDFFLRYRISVTDIPSGITSGRGIQCMLNPRVTACRWGNYDYSVWTDLQNDGYTEKPAWLWKIIYYPGEADEPRETAHFQALKSRAEQAAASNPDYRMVIPLERNLWIKEDGTVVSNRQAAAYDSVGFVMKYTNIYCPKLDAFTPRELTFVKGSSTLQTPEHDLIYGTYVDRVNAEVAKGDELWTYICINPTQPYVNWQILSDGTETIVSLWQMKQLGVTGLLYWGVNVWKVNYWDNTTNWPGPAQGDGNLIYSGYKFRIFEPVSSIRLEGVRDGIEDYQMLCMLEKKLGTEAVQNLISKITTSVVTYTNDDDYIHAVRVRLGDMLEQAMRG